MLKDRQNLPISPSAGAVQEENESSEEDDPNNAYVIDVSHVEWGPSGRYLVSINSDNDEFNCVQLYTLRSPLLPLPTANWPHSDNRMRSPLFGRNWNISDGAAHRHPVRREHRARAIGWELRRLERRPEAEV